MDINKIILEELNEIRHLQVQSDLNQFKSNDLESNKPIMDDEVIRVYHGFYKESDGLLAAKYGLSGKEYARRIYSYEIGNNPKGLFVSIQFDTVKRNFAGSGIIMEFSTIVSDLEAPVWVGGRNYFVQGEYTSSFKNDDERQQQQLLNREKHKQSEFPAIANSDRPELAWALYEGAEKQALYTGDLNPNMIQAFWVNENLKNNNRTDGQWQRMSRQQFLKKYWDEERFKETNVYSKNVGYNDRYLEKYNKIVKPADDFSEQIFRDYLEASEYDYDEFVELNIKNWDDYIMNSMFYPKQIQQIKKYYNFNEIINEEIQNYLNNNFWKWFGSSKVVDGNNKPLVVYHGTTNDFEKFKGKIMYFSGSKYASDFAQKQGLAKNDTGGSVMPVYLSIERPLDLTEFGVEEYSADELIIFLKNKNIPAPNNLFKYNRNDMLPVWYWIKLNGDFILPAIQAEGYDGIFVMEKTSYAIDTAYIVFEPNQVKSAMGNDGDFSNNNPDIIRETK